VPTAVRLDGKPVPATADESVSSLPTSASYTLTVSCRANMRPRRWISRSTVPPSAPGGSQGAVQEPENGSTSAVEPKQIAQFLPPPKLPMRIEAANFDKGGDGLAFHVNSGHESVYRQDGVPIVNSTDAGGGYAIPDLKQGDWLAYTLDAGDGGWFAISARVLPATDGTLVFLRDRVKVLTTVDIPAPGQSGPAWISAPGQSPFYLPPGEQIIVTVRVEKPGFQLGNFTFTKAQGRQRDGGSRDGRHDRGAGFNNDHEGYKGEGFVAGDRQQTSSVKIPVNVPADGKYLVALRYANGSGDAAVSHSHFRRPEHHLCHCPPLRSLGAITPKPARLSNSRPGKMEILISGTDAGIVNLDQLKLIPMDEANGPRQ
jgi:hypothetical protein